MASGERTNGRGDYHHGNLREALIEAAMSMIAERGLAGFALAELARALGVSTSAPYKHFRDRTAVIAEVARRGFVQLAADLEAARDAAGTDPINALERCAQAHLAFATHDPPVYAAMFEATFPRGEYQDVVRAREAAFNVIRATAQVAVSRGTSPDRPPVQMVALHVWTMTHGIADMFVSHDGDGRRLLPMAPEALLEAGLLVYLGSLGLVR
jgi:AcrR family transcriptional regulator